jgi:Ca-dependent carbohydrate-binding module xylan-binding
MASWGTLARRLTACLLLAGCTIAGPSERIEAPAPAAGPVTPSAEAISVDLAGWLVKDGRYNTYDRPANRLAFYTDGTAEGVVRVSADGDYEIVVSASGTAALGEYPQFVILLDGSPVGQTSLTTEASRSYRLVTPIKAGEHKLAIQFTNDAYKENEYDRDLYIETVSLRPVSSSNPA